MIIGSNVRIIVVDDEVAIQDALKHYFEFKGYSVRTAGNGREALQLLDEESAEVVITDIMMPEMNGIQLLRELKKSHPMIRVIVITGYVTLDNLLATFRLGAEKCIYKPIVDFNDLDSSVEAAIESLRDWQKKLMFLNQLKGNNE